MARRGYIVAAGFALLAMAGGARADGRLWIATGEVYKDSDYYFSLGTVLPFPGSTLGAGWVQRYWLDTYSYSYDANGVDIDAAVWGAEAMFGYQASRPGLSGAIYGGVRYTNADLSPDDPGSDLRGSQFWPKAQVEGEVGFAPRWRANAIASYTFRLDGYWTRLRVLRDLPNGHFVGPEVVAQGDPNYEAQKLGVAYGNIQLFDKVFLTVKGGYRWQSGADSPYAGVEVVGEF